MDNSVSIIIVAYNHKEYLEKCIGSIDMQDYPHEIIIVDNGSTDGTAEFIENIYPAIQLIRNKNTGFGAGNNLGVKYTTGVYVVFLNPDTLVEENWLRNLIAPIRLDSRVITTPKILLYNRSAINTCGNINHITGLTFTRGLLEPPQSRNQQEEVSGISGACFAMRKEEFIRIGGFDERFFLYNEDSEFSWRAHYFNNPILYVPSSVIHHDYSLNVSLQKMYYLEKGRYLILKTYFSWKMSVILMPSLIVAEILTFGYATRFGWTGIACKIRAFYDGLILTRSSLHRKGTEIIEHLETQIPTDQLVSNPIEHAVLRMCNHLFSWNYVIYKRFCLRQG
jgi:GT2 family glycosyltransferase